jgi:hypothetical protein
MGPTAAAIHVGWGHFMVVTLPPLRWHACRQANGIAVEQA